MADKIKTAVQLEGFGRKAVAVEFRFPALGYGDYPVVQHFVIQGCAINRNRLFHHNFVHFDRFSFAQNGHAHGLSFFFLQFLMEFLPGEKAGSA